MQLTAEDGQSTTDLLHCVSLHVANVMQCKHSNARPQVQYWHLGSSAQNCQTGSSSLKTRLLDLQLGTVRKSDVVKRGHGVG